MGALSGVVNHPIQRKLFPVQNHLSQRGLVIHRQMTVNTFIMDQCVLSDMKIYNRISTQII